MANAQRTKHPRPMPVAAPSGFAGKQLLEPALSTGKPKAAMEILDTVRLRVLSYDVAEFVRAVRKFERDLGRLAERGAPQDVLENGRKLLALIRTARIVNDPQNPEIFFEEDPNLLASEVRLFFRSVTAEEMRSTARAFADAMAQFEKTGGRPLGEKFFSTLWLAFALRDVETLDN